MTHVLIDEPDREERLTEALLAYVEARQAGREPDRGQFLAAHPDLRGELEEFFAGHDEVERLAAAVRAEGGGWRAESKTPSTPPTLDTRHQGELGDFRLLREIGRGGMGVVYEAEQISLRRRVALKVLPFAAALDARQLQRFKNEALAAAHLRHENIVPVYMVGEERGVHYYAMQFVEGRSLAAVITELRGEQCRMTNDECRKNDETLMTKADSGAGVRNSGLGEIAVGLRHSTFDILSSLDIRHSFFFRAVAQLGLQAALALDHAHGLGVVHRDVKPANLLLDTRGQLWVTDFGLAQMAGDAGLTATGEMLGTLRYASPEQVLARQGVVDQRSDVYSLGATLYELLTLRPIFEGRDRNELLRQIADEEPRRPRTLLPSVPRELETVVLKALRKEPSERYPTARALADDLQRFLDNRPVLARRPTAAERLRKLARRHPTLVGAGAVVLVLLTAGSSLSTLLIANEQERTRTEQRNAEEAYRRERQRAEEAESRFRLARRSVDEMFRISQEELADRPGLEGLRKRLLGSVLAYYQEFLEQRRDDPEARADLLDAKQRVEAVVADLAVLRAASHLYLLCQPAVLDDLGLADEQRPRVKEFCARVGKEWLESLADVGRLSPTERGRRAVARSRAYEAEVNRLLTTAQQARLRQIGLQAEGPSAFREPEVVAALSLTVEQRDEIRMIEDEAVFGWMRGPRPNPTPGTPEKSANERLVAVLSEDQVRRWKALSGEPVKFPIAPFGSPP